MTIAAWLLPAFIRSVQALGAQADEEKISRIGRALIDSWQSPERTFHSVKHLVAVLERLDILAIASHHPDALRVAAWYHGAIYRTPAPGLDPRRFGEDTQAGAVRARLELTELRVPPAMVDYVEKMVVNIGGAGPRDVDCAVLCDADLAILGATPQKYRDYRTKIREEYRELDPLTYVVGRLAALERLLVRPAIFRTSAGKQWEEAARQNLASEQARLEAELAELDPDGSLRAELLAHAEVDVAGEVPAAGVPEATTPRLIVAPLPQPVAPAAVATPIPGGRGAHPVVVSPPVDDAAARPTAKSAELLGGEKAVAGAAKPVVSAANPVAGAAKPVAGTAKPVAADGSDGVHRVEVTQRIEPVPGLEIDSTQALAPVVAPAPQRRSVAELMAALDCPRAAEDDFSSLETCLEDLDAFDPRPAAPVAAKRPAAPVAAAEPAAVEVGNAGLPTAGGEGLGAATDGPEL